MSECLKCKECEDAVSRQAAIEALHQRFVDGFEEDRWWNSTHVLAALEGLPSTQPDPFVDADKLKRCRFEYINACKTLHNRTPDTRQQDIYDAYAVIKALQPIFGEEAFE